MNFFVVLVFPSAGYIAIRDALQAEVEQTMSLSPLSEFFLIHSLFLSCFTQEDIPSRLYLMPVVVCHHICSQFKLKKGTVDHLDPSIHSVISLDPVFKKFNIFLHAAEHNIYKLLFLYCILLYVNIVNIT